MRNVPIPTSPFENLIDDVIQSQNVVLELPYHPEHITITAEEPRKERLEMEDLMFDPDRYLQDCDIDACAERERKTWFIFKLYKWYRIGY